PANPHTITPGIRSDRNRVNRFATAVYTWENMPKGTCAVHRCPLFVLRLSRDVLRDRLGLNRFPLRVEGHHSPLRTVLRSDNPDPLPALVRSENQLNLIRGVSALLLRHRTLRVY